MGLDMYLSRMPRHKGATVRDISKVEHYLDWLRAKADGSKYANCTFKEWCGYDEAPSRDNLEFYADHYKAYYSEYDTEKKHPWMKIMEDVGYWRKANQIHNWFVENIQDGIDDCDYHREVTEEDLEELLDVCKTVLNSCELVEGEINNGWECVNGQRIPIIEYRKYVRDPSVAMELLPSRSGFFFGSYNYDEWYIDQIKHTIDIIMKVLETTDFETQMLYYCSSW